MEELEGNQGRKWEKIRGGKNKTEGTGRNLEELGGNQGGKREKIRGKKIKLEELGGTGRNWEELVGTLAPQEGFARGRIRTLPCSRPVEEG